MSNVTHKIYNIINEDIRSLLWFSSDWRTQLRKLKNGESILFRQDNYTNYYFLINDLLYHIIID